MTLEELMSIECITCGGPNPEPKQRWMRYLCRLWPPCSGPTTHRVENVCRPCQKHMAAKMRLHMYKKYGADNYK